MVHPVSFRSFHQYTCLLSTVDWELSVKQNDGIPLIVVFVPSIISSTLHEIRTV